MAEIHIQNHVTPDSPFGDRRRLAAWIANCSFDEFRRHTETAARQAGLGTRSDKHA